MPVRLLSSSVLKWPDAATVDQAVRHWVEKIKQERKEIRRIGYFGSYARGDWGVGSDLDLIIVVKNSELTFHRRAIEWDTSELPVPVDLLIYTEGEWQRLDRQGKFFKMLSEQAIWIFIQDND